MEIVKADEIRTFGDYSREITLKIHSKAGKINVRISGRVLNTDFALMAVPADAATAMAIAYVNSEIAKEPS